VATYRLTLEYDGTRYRGWQVQQNAKSVAGELHRALAGAGLEVVDLGGSGRTDAGVHALAQVAHLRLRRRVDAERLRDELNDRLPADVHVLALAAAPDRFHARHDAVSRSYLYQLATRRTAFHKRYVWWVRRRLDLAAMRAAAASFVGRHDFRAFCERPQEQTSTLVEVEAVDVVPAEELVLVRFVASHFLWKMVRRLMGALVRVGTHELSPEQLRALLAADEHAVAGSAVAEWTAPPSGLFLERVLYRGDGPLLPPAPVTPITSPPRRTGGGAGRAG
jgi:tRNA pseudouridine38-40 synthase